MDSTSSVLPTSCWKGAFPAPTEFQVTEPKHPLAALGMGLAAATDASRTLLLVNKFHYHWKKIQLVQSTLRSMQRRKDSCERATLSPIFSTNKQKQSREKYKENIGAKLITNTKKQKLKI